MTFFALRFKCLFWLLINSYILTEKVRNVASPTQELQYLFMYLYQYKNKESKSNKEQEIRCLMDQDLREMIEEAWERKSRTPSSGILFLLLVSFFLFLILYLNSFLSFTHSLTLATSILFDDNTRKSAKKLEIRGDRQRVKGRKEGKIWVRREGKSCVRRAIDKSFASFDLSLLFPDFLHLLHLLLLLLLASSFHLLHKLSLISCKNLKKELSKRKQIKIDRKTGPKIREEKERSPRLFLLRSKGKQSMNPTRSSCSAALFLLSIWACISPDFLPSSNHYQGWRQILSLFFRHCDDDDQLLQGLLSLFCFPWDWKKWFPVSLFFDVSIAFVIVLSNVVVLSLSLSTYFSSCIL